MAMYIIEHDDSFQHWGIKGQKWGVRRYENEDGTLTDEGKARYRKDAAEARREIGEASRNPMDNVGTLEGRYMMTGWGGGKYRRLNRTIMNNTRSEAKEYDKARWEATKAKTEKNAILFRKTREELAKEAIENQRKAGRKFSDAVASIGVGVLTGGAAPAIVSAGSQAAGALLGTGIRLGVTNKVMLKYGYNSKLTGEGFKPSYQRGNNNG